MSVPHRNQTDEMVKPHYLFLLAHDTILITTTIICLLLSTLFTFQKSQSPGLLSIEVGAPFTSPAIVSESAAQAGL